jgi:hypothetical protein
MVSLRAGHLSNPLRSAGDKCHGHSHKYVEDRERGECQPETCEIHKRTQQQLANRRGADTKNPNTGDAASLAEPHAST